MIFMPIFQQGFRVVVGAVVLLTVGLIATCNKSYSLMAIAGIIISILLLLFLKGESLGEVLERERNPPPRGAYVGTFQSSVYPNTLVRGNAWLYRWEDFATLCMTYSGTYRNGHTAHVHHDGALTNTLTAPFEGSTVTFTFETLNDTEATGTYALDLPHDSGTFTLRRQGSVEAE